MCPHPIDSHHDEIDGHASRSRCASSPLHLTGAAIPDRQRVRRAQAAAARELHRSAARVGVVDRQANWRSVVEAGARAVDHHGRDAAGPLPGPPIATSDNAVDVRAAERNSIGLPVSSKTYRSNDSTSFCRTEARKMTPEAKQAYR